MDIISLDDGRGMTNEKYEFASSFELFVNKICILLETLSSVDIYL